MKRAVLYVRVSTADQVENFSLDTQLERVPPTASVRALEVDEIFREEGESAKTANRPSLKAMLDYCVKNKVKSDIAVVVVYKLDRFARPSGLH